MQSDALRRRPRLFGPSFQCERSCNRHALMRRDSSPCLALLAPSRRFGEANDEATSTLTLTNKHAGELSLHYTRPDADHITVEGTVHGARIVARTAGTHSRCGRSSRVSE